MRRHIAWFLVALSLPLPAFALTQQIALEKFSSHPVMTLTCIGDEQSLDIPIPDRWTIKKINLTLHYTSSNNLIADLAQLGVKLNTIPVAQFKLNPASPDMTVELALPVQYLEPGYNRLAFRVAQHFMTRECERPCSPDLWTAVNLKDSVLSIEYEEKPVPLSLASVSDFMFDPKVFPEGHVNLITEDRSSDALTVLGMTASGIARRFDYRNVTFSVSRDLQPGADNVLVGRRAFVSSFLAGHGLSLGNTEGGYLKILPMPGAKATAMPTTTGAQEPGAEAPTDPNHALLVVTGEQYDHVKLAAATLANLSYGFPGAPELTAHKLRMPDVPEYAGREVVRANKTYDFKTLNFSTTSFKGINPSGKVINFRLPVDFLIKQNLTAKLNLHFSYGAGMRETSALNVVVNDKVVRAIHLGDKDGGYFENYVIDIPTYLFRPGSNTIAFGVELQPSLKECDLALMGNMFLTIFENSSLTFPDMPHFVELPKLELFMLNGFPFTRWPDGFESKIYMAGDDDASVTAMLNLIGLITQKNGFPLLGLQVDREPPTAKWKGDLIVIGPPASVPQEFRARSPLSVGNKTEIPYPVVRDWEGEYTIAYSTQSNHLGGDRGYLMEFESPFEPGRTVVVMAAENSSSLLKLSMALMEPEVQAQAQGGIMLVETGAQHTKPKVTSFQIGTRYTTGKAGKSSQVESFLYDHPYLYYVLIVLLTLSFALALYWALQRYRASRKLGRSAGK